MFYELSNLDSLMRP